MTSETTGTGSLTLGTAVSGCLTFANAGVANGTVVSYGISDGANSEVGKGTYSSDGPTLSRDSVLASTNDGGKINCTGTQHVFITSLAQDVVSNIKLDNVPHHKMWIPAGYNGFKPRLTTGCGALAQLEMPTNKTMYDYLPFGASSSTFAYANVVMPDDYTGGGTYFIVYWLHPATTTNFGVYWQITGNSINNNETLDVTPTNFVSAIDTGGITNKLYISPLTGSLAFDLPSPTSRTAPGARDIIAIRVGRLPTNEADTLAVNAYFLGLMMYYPVE